MVRILFICERGLYALLFMRMGGGMGVLKDAHIHIFHEETITKRDNRVKFDPLLNKF